MHAKLIARTAALLVSFTSIVLLSLRVAGWISSALFPIPQPWTFVGFIGVGFCIWLSLLINPSKITESFRFFLAYFIFAVGVVTLTQYWAQADFGIDRLLFPLSLGPTVHPGRPAAATGFNFLLLGIGLLFYRAQERTIAVFSEAAALTSFTFCYLYVANGLRITSQVNVDAMAPVAAALFLISAFILLVTRPEGRLMSLLRSSGSAGIFARWLMPVPLVLPVVTRVIRDIGVSLHLFDAKTTILSFLDILCGIFLVWGASVQVFRVDRLRQQAEDDLRGSRDDLDRKVQIRTRELQNANATLTNLVDASPLAICAWNIDGSVRKSNLAANRLLEPNAAHFEPLIARAKQGETIAAAEITLDESAESKTFQVWASPLRTESGVQNGTLLFAADVSERKAFDTKLLQTQKLESLGVLAGGIAHDFNNLLTGIMGNASLLLDSQGDDPFAAHMLEQVVTASRKAADLTSQMLAYAGKGRFVLRPVDLSQFVREIDALIHTSVGKHVRLNFELSDDLPLMEMDPSHIQQIVMNLVINAAEASSGPDGEVLVSTSVGVLDSEFIRRRLKDSSLLPGRYVRLEVRDNGPGIDEAIQERIFEPFFTTKFTGRGLGLAAVHGILRTQSAGLVLDSAPGKGASFQLFFPAFRDIERAAVKQRKTLPSASGSEYMVLVVDDESIVRDAAWNALTALNYRVRLADSGNRALELLTTSNGDMSLIILDLTMPGLSGQETHARIKEMFPDVPILISSGFDQSEAERSFEGIPLDGFLRKPFSSSELASAVQSLLQRSSLTVNS